MSLCVCVCVCVTMKNVPVCRSFPFSGSLHQRSCSTHAKREKKKTFQLLYHFPFTSLFVCTHVLWRTLHTLTNNLLFYIFLFLSLLTSYLEAFDIHPSYSFPPCICFCVTMASCYEALNVNDPDRFTLSPFFSELSRSHQPKSGGMNVGC